MKKTNFKRILGGRIVASLPIIAIQCFIFYVIIVWLKPFETYIYSGLTILSMILVLFVISKRKEGAYRSLWLLIILLTPIPGGLMYLMYGNKKTTKKLSNKIKVAAGEIPLPDIHSFNMRNTIYDSNPRISQTFQLVEKLSGFPVVTCNNSKYYQSGEEIFSAILEHLKSATDYIFLEYFIVKEGRLWNEITDILIQKVSEGVEVRIIYDDIGSISSLSLKQVKYLRSKGVFCELFNPLIGITKTLNNRDHRKLLVIDGKVAFSGGVNIADEYINIDSPYGHWKDIGFKVTGIAVMSYLYMFIEFWNAFSKNKITKEQLTCIEQNLIFEDSKIDGFVQPYYDTPSNNDPVSNNLYIDLLGQAMEYAWFYTPYLMLGDNLMEAFIRAAHRGIDVRIFMPGIPDKKIVYRLSRSYYRELLQAGVKIYEYTPGFLHGKACLVDDVIGTIGTVNLDYRSLFLHFECNALFYQASLLGDLKEDFVETQLKSKERLLIQEKNGAIGVIINHLLRVIAPLL